MKRRKNYYCYMVMTKDGPYGLISWTKNGIKELFRNKFGSYPTGGNRVVRIKLLEVK